MSEQQLYITSARDLILLAGSYSRLLIFLLCIPPLLALLLRLLHKQGQGGESPWNYFYSLLVYLACIPGILSAVLTAYVLFFTNENLLDVSLVVYFIPILSMTITLILIQQTVSFKLIPGFDRLSGLMVMISAAFVIVLALSRTRIWLFFGGSIYTFFALAAVIFSLIKWGVYMAFRRRGQPRKDMPSFPDNLK